MGGEWEWLLIVALLAAWAVFRHARRPARAGRRASTAAHPFHSVSIRPRGAACEIVRRIAGERFLAADAPLLPLPGCTRRDCRCVYEHFDDRRLIDRRALEVPGMPVAHHGAERRGRGRGRRSTDHAAA
jgi:hypothetical protein